MHTQEQGGIEHLLDIPLQAGKGLSNPALIIQNEQLDPVLIDNRAVKIHTQAKIILEFLQSMRGPQEAVFSTEQHPSIEGICFHPGGQIIFRIIGDRRGFQLTFQTFFPDEVLEPSQFRDRQ